MISVRTEGGLRPVAHFFLLYSSYKFSLGYYFCMVTVRQQMQVVCQGTMVNQSELVKLWNRFFKGDKLTAEVDAHLKHRVQILRDLAVVKKDSRFSGIADNLARFGQYYSPESDSIEKRIQRTIDNYVIGRKIEAQHILGNIDGRFVVSMEPHFPINKQESMWTLMLGDVSKKGNSVIARVGLNFHNENNQVVMSVPVIQGSPEGKEILDEFRRRIKKPWPVFMMKIVHSIALNNGIQKVRGIPELEQPFFKKPEFKSGKRVGKGGYSLYAKTFDIMGYSPPDKRRSYYEIDSTAIKLRPSTQINLLKAFGRPLDHPIMPRVKKGNTIRHSKKPK